MSELFMRFPNFKTKALTLSYDDGTVFDREMVSILNRYAIKCTFNLNSNFLNGSGRISANEINDLYKGHEIAVHTYTHPHLENLDSANVAGEIIKDREFLETVSGRLVKGMAYPFGLADDSITEIVKACGIDYARTTNSTLGFSLPHDFLKWNPTCHHSYQQIDTLIDKFLAEDDWEHPWRITAKVFYLWGHSYEFENRFEILENICKKLSHKDTVWYATNGEIYKYVKEYSRLEFSANGKTIYNPTATDLYAFTNNKNILISAGKMIKIEGK